MNNPFSRIGHCLEGLAAVSTANNRQEIEATARELKEFEGNFNAMVDARVDEKLAAISGLDPAAFDELAQRVSTNEAAIKALQDNAEAAAAEFEAEASQPAGAGNDTITGAQGNDTITGGAGDQTLDAGTGNDVIQTGDPAATPDAGAANDALGEQSATAPDENSLTGGNGADNV